MSQHPSASWCALLLAQGRALFADKVTSGPVPLPGGGVRQLRKVDTTYIFPGALPAIITREQVEWNVCHDPPGSHGRMHAPASKSCPCRGPLLSTALRLSPSAGLALGVMMSRSTRVREDMLLEAAKVNRPSKPRCCGPTVQPEAIVLIVPCPSE